MSAPDLGRLNEWARRLGGEVSKIGGQPVVRCPGPNHSSDDDSLIVSEDERDPDGFKVSSFSEKDQDWKVTRDYVKTRLGRAPGPPAKANGHTKPRRKVVAQYVFNTETGAPAFRKTRYDPKTFSVSRPTASGGWEPGGVADQDQVPFHLPRMLAAPPEQPVILCEGEKATLEAEKHGLVATCASMGAGRWWPSLNRYFAGKIVIITPDLDEPGWQHALKARANLLGVAASVKIVRLPDLGPGEDLFDYLARGGNPQAIADLPDEPPAAEPVNARAKKSTLLNGAVVLAAIHDFLGRFVAYPDEHAQIAHVLWIAHTHLIDRFDSTPRLAALSPEPASGKTRLLEVTELLVPRPMLAVEFSPAFLFRMISDEDGLPTILHDEVDAVFGGRAPQHEELRSLLNSGHRRGAFVGRVSPQGKKFVLEKYPAFCPVALAGLGDLPETLMSRSLILRMRRRAPGEVVEPFRRRLVEGDAEQLRNELAEWAESAGPSIRWPEMPPGVEDRSADCWEPLLAVADAAGGPWPGWARVAAVTFVTRSPEESLTLGVRLLGDLRQVFGDADQMFTEDILAALNRLDESPWGDLRGKPLDARGLAKMLRKYGVRPATVRIDAKTAKGYASADLYDAWARYVPSTPETSVTSVTTDTGAEP